MGAFFELAVLDCFLILGLLISVGCVTIRQQTSRDVKGRQGTSKDVKGRQQTLKGCNQLLLTLV